MRVIDYLNDLAKAKQLRRLVGVGLIPVRAYTQREIFNTHQALVGLPTYADSPRLAVQETASACRVKEVTVYRALAAMTQQL